MTARPDQPQRVEALFPLTPMQQGMLFHSLLDPASRAYVVQIRCTLDGPLDAAALRAAWQSVVDRHAALRTAFAWQRAEGSVQIVWSHATVPWRDADCSDEPVTRSADLLNDLVARDRETGFDLARAPLLRLTLVKLGVDRHVLVWTMHHIILDGWSVARVLDEVTTAYANGGALAGTPPRPFSDFVAWQSARPRDAAESYWRTSLRGVEEATSPFGRPVTKSAAAVPRDVCRSLDATRTRALSALAERAHVTLSTIVLGAWCLVLSRITGRRDVMTGVTVAGRPPELPGVEEMVGLFINTLPFRASVDQDRPVAEWLRDVQRQSAELREHGHVSLVDVQEWSGLARTTPLFDHLFVFENYPASGAAGTVRGVTIGDVSSVEPTEYPLTIVVVPGDELSVQFSYDAATVTDADIERLAEQFVAVLDALPAGPELPLWRHASVRAGERAQVIETWNATDCAWSGSLAPHELFEQQAQRTPDAPAAEAGGSSLTYRALDERANQLAHHLAALGVGRESTVGIFMDRSLEMLIAVLATLKAGGACVPLDPAYPADRLAFMAADADLAVLLTQRALETRAPGGARAVVIVDAEESAIAAHSVEPMRARVDPDGAFYVIYTSGSTGKPKGIVLPHGAMGNLVRWHMEALRPAPHMLQFASLSFDASFHEMFAAWATGGCVYLITEDLRHDVDALLRFVASRPIDRVILPVVVLQGWAAEHADELALFENLREIITTGEQLQITQPIVRLMRQLPHATLHNHYGPAETHVVTAHTLGADHDAWPAHPPVGAPVANSQAYVLDPWLMPVPVGVSGELYLGGANLARGYAGRPDLTAAKFVPDPFGRAGGRLYRTGDQARWLADGTLEYLGRLDLMVKIRGNRVELGEVEASLGDHPSVGSCAVAVYERAPGDKRLVAYCVAAEGASMDASALRAHLAARLPDYMLPSTFVELAAMPLTPNGKIDRRALPRPDADQSRGEPAVKPRDLVEEVLTRAWSDVLGVPRVGARDHFFELGGHSLTAVQILARVRNAFGVVPPLRSLFEHPVLADFATDVRAAMGAPVAPRAPIEPRALESAAAPLSPAQERLYFLQRLDPQSTAYNLGGRLRLDGQLDVAALESALREVVSRHEVLRTRFTSVDGVAQQSVASIDELALRRVDVSMLDASSGESEADRFCRRELARPFDLASELPLRAALIAMSPERHALSLTIHHIAADGSSIEIFVRELAAIYEAAIAGRSSPLATPVLQYADVATHLRTQDVDSPASLDFWRSTLAGVEPLELPADRPRPAVSRFRGASIVWTFDAALSENVETLARATGSTPSVVCLAAFAELLRRYARTADVAIAMPVSLRDRVELEGMIGLLLNTVIVRLDAPGHLTVRELLQRTRATLLDAFAHRDVPFERVVDAVRPARDRGRAPIAQVMFDYHAWREDATEAGRVRFSLEDVGVETTKFDLLLVVERRDAGFAASLEYDVDLFDAASAEAMREHFETLLRGLARDVTAPLARIEMTTADERARLAAWGSPVAGAPGPASILPLLDVAWSDAADSVALTDADGALTYRELAQRVNARSAELRATGVGRGSVVAIEMERSRELVIEILAVLRAGAAFVPLDPSAPAEHRQWIVGDSAACRPERSQTISRPERSEGSAFVHPVTQEQIPRCARDDKGHEQIPRCARDDEGQEQIPRCARDDNGQEQIPRFARDDNGQEQIPRCARDDNCQEQIPRCARDDEGDDLAYILYTSGSTGRPKGCQISHRALAAYLTWAARYYFDGDRRDAGNCALFTAITFDLTITSLFLPLLRGRTLAILPADVPPAELPALALDSADVVKLTPSHVTLLAAEPPRPNVRVVIVGGEHLGAEHVSILERVAPNAAIYNEYGPTEATVGCVAARVTTRDERIFIGRPVDHARVAVLDDAGRLAPANVFGELYVGGPSLAHGYVRRAALTAERFVPDAAAREPGARLYRTGDLARWTRAGELEYAGRVDDQLKIRGHRVEPSGVAAVLETHPSVTQAAVVGDPAGPAPTRLVAYVVTADAVEPAALRAFLEVRVPSYMVPALFVCVAALPLTAHGKLDRRALPAPDRDSATSASIVAPRSETEHLLAGVWRDVLHLESVGVHDNFFDLGGDSIISMQVVSRAASRGVDITVDGVFRHQTIAALAASADTVRRGDVPPAPPAAVAVFGPMVPTPIQRWFFELDLPNPNHFNQAVVLAVASADAAAIEAALNALRGHHDALRLVARSAGDEWTLEIEHDERARPIVLQRVDLSRTARASRASEIERLAAAAQTTIDLAAGPPLVAVLFDCGAHEPARLLVAIHHLAVDAVSWRILLEDLESAYAAIRRGEPVRLPPKTASIIEWAAANAALSQDPAVTDAPGGSAIAPDHPGGDLQADEREVVVSLDGSETESLAGTLRRLHDARVDDTLLAALAVAVNDRCPRGLLVDVEGHGRSPTGGLDCSRTVGWFTTMHSVVLPAAGSLGPGALLAAVQKRSRVGATTRASVLFNYHGNLDVALVADGAFTAAAESPGPEKDPRGRRSHAIEITASIVDGCLRIVWAFGTQRFDHATIASLAAAQLDALRGFLSDSVALDDTDLSALEAELLD